MEKEKELPWVDDIVVAAADGMGDLVQYATDIITLGGVGQDNPGWTKKWNRGADDSTFDYIPGGFDVIRWLIDAIGAIHDWEAEGFGIESLEEMSAKFRETHSLDEVYWTGDGISEVMAQKSKTLAIALGFAPSDITEAFGESDDDEESDE